jgi:hypothetical protein
MPLYEWRGADSFRDHRNDRTVAPGDVVELNEHVAEPQSELVRVDEESGATPEERDMAGNVAGEDICGYETDDGTLCQRDAGWGRDTDSGRCKDHHDES